MSDDFDARRAQAFAVAYEAIIGAEYALSVLRICGSADGYFLTESEIQLLKDVRALTERLRDTSEQLERSYALEVAYTE